MAQPSTTNPASTQLEVLVLLTQNTEYHVRDRRCIGVKDRHSGEWQMLHAAVGQRIGGALTWSADGAVQLREAVPGIGERICFEDIALISSCILDIQTRRLTGEAGVTRDAA